MTLDRDGNGTGRFVAAPFTGQRDAFGLLAPAANQGYASPLPQHKFEITGSYQKQQIVTWRLTIFDLRAGLNSTRAGILESHGRSKTSTLDTRFEGQMILPLLIEVQTTPDPLFQAGGDPLQLSHLNIFDTLVIAAGGQPNACLFKETSATDPTLVALNYDFNVGATNHNIYGLASVAINSQVPRLCIYGGKAAEVLSNVNATPSVAGTISDSAVCQGIIQTPLPDQPILFYQFNAIGALNAASGFNASIVHTINVPTSGGYVVGLSGLAGGRLRVFWVFPRSGNTTGMLTLGSELPGDLYSTSLEGYDLTKHELPLRWVYYAAIWRDGIVATDGQRVVFTNGRIIRDLRIFADREADSTRELVVRGLRVNGPELIARLNDVSVDASKDTIEWEESYDFDLNAWLPLTSKTTLSTTGLQGLNAPGGLPVSQFTGYMHNYSAGAWRRQLLAPYGVNPYGLRQTTSGATGRQFAASGTWRSTTGLFPGRLETVPKIIDRFTFGGEDNLGDVLVSAGGVTHTFKGPVNKRSRTREFAANRTRFVDLDTTITLTQPGGNTRTTPQALPIIIEGRAFLDERQSGQWRGW